MLAGKPQDFPAQTQVLPAMNGGQCLMFSPAEYIVQMVIFDSDLYSIKQATGKLVTFSSRKILIRGQTHQDGSHN